MTDAELINRMIQEDEGGYLYTTYDVPTRCGITLDTFQDYHPDATEEDLKACRLEEIHRIYTEGYLNPVRGAPKKMIPAVFSCAVNCGTRTAVSILQKAVNVTIEPVGKQLLICDGSLGPRTQAAAEVAVAAHGDDCILTLFVREWMDHYASIRMDAAQKYQNGWRARALRYLPNGVES